MKTTVVPAQITTVEDKIAGSLNFIQILLLVFSLIIGTALYGLIPPKLHLSTIKIAMIIVQFTIFGTLAIRYRGRILADWLIIYLRYRARPRIYIFDKRDISGRFEVKEVLPQGKEKLTGKERLKEGDMNKYDNIITPKHYGTIIAVKPSKKGGLDVEYQEV